MSHKFFDVDGVGRVRIVKSTRSKHLRLTIKPNNLVNVSVPSWTTYNTALKFVHSKAIWIDNHKLPESVLISGTKIGKAHRLFLVPANVKRPYSTVGNNEIRVKFPETLRYDDPIVQAIANKKCIQALTNEAKELLPQRLKYLADHNSFTFNSVSIKTLKSRWGSCTNKKDITLSCFMMQLSWKQIDYVILHELTHTVHMAHNAKFWDYLVSCMPEAKEIRKQLSSKKPHVVGL